MIAWAVARRVMMSTIGALFAGSIALVLAAGCGSENSPQATQSSVGAQSSAAVKNEIVIDGEAEYRGVFGEGNDVTRTVAIRNNGKEPVIVRVLSRSCGCLKATLDAVRLEPGKEAALRLSTSAAAGPGAIQQQWAGLGVYAGGTAEPVLVERVTLSYRAARDWRVVPGVLTGIAPIGSEIEIEAYVQSSSDTPIKGVAVGECDVHGFTGSAEQVAPAIWRVTLTGKLDSLAEMRGSLPIEIQYEHGTKVRIPVSLRGLNSGSFDPPGVVIDESAARRTLHVKFDMLGLRANHLEVRVVPESSALRVGTDAAGAFTLTLESGVLTDYGGGAGGSYQQWDAAGPNANRRDNSYVTCSAFEAVTATAESPAPHFSSDSYRMRRHTGLPLDS
jgi:hypothetical protein